MDGENAVIQITVRPTDEPGDKQILSAYASNSIISINV